MGWKGIPYSLSDVSNTSSSIVIDKISELTINTSLWGTMIAALAGAVLPSFIAWLAIRNNKKDNKNNRDTTLNAAKFAIYAQTTSESTRKNIDTVITLTAHFMSYCTALILAMKGRNYHDSGYDKFDYSKNRLELVLINNKLKLLITDDYVYPHILILPCDADDSHCTKPSMLGQLEKLLDMTENYYRCKVGIKQDELYIEYTSKDIEDNVHFLADITKEYVKFKEKKLYEELAKNQESKNL